MAVQGTRGRGIQLVLATLAFTICFAVWGSISSLAPVFKDLYHLSASQVALLVAVPTLLGSVARFPLGLVTDRFGGRIVFSVLLFILLVPMALMAVTNSYPLLLGVAFLIGLAGASFAIGVPFVSGWFPPERQGLALGIYGLGNVGTAISSFFLPQIAKSAGWPAAYLALMPALLLGGLLYVLVGRNAPSFTASRVSVADRLIVLKQKPMAWVLSLFYFVTFGGFVALSSYLPTFLVSEYRLPKTTAGGLTSLFVIVAILARPLGGYLADRIKATSILSVVFLAVAVLQIVLAFEPSLPVLTSSFLLIALLLGLGNGAVFKLVGVHFPHNAGVVAGLVGAIGGMGGFFPPLVMGMVKDATGTYALGFMLLSEFSLVCLVVNMLVLQRLVLGRRRGLPARAAAQRVSQAQVPSPASVNGHLQEPAEALEQEQPFSPNA